MQDLTSHPDPLLNYLAKKPSSEKQVIQLTNTATTMNKVGMIVDVDDVAKRYVLHAIQAQCTLPKDQRSLVVLDFCFAILQMFIIFSKDNGVTYSQFLMVDSAFEKGLLR